MSPDCVAPVALVASYKQILTYSGIVVLMGPLLVSAAIVLPSGLSEALR
jgi:hypothetical protein